MISEFFKNLLVELFLEYKRKLNLKTVPKLILKHNTKNAKDIFGKLVIMIQKRKQLYFI